MKNLLLPLPLLVFLLFSCKQNSNPSQWNYPVTKKVDTVDKYHGVSVPDPYRWLENDTSKETAEWVAAQNKVTSEYLSKIPFREKIRERLTKIWNYTKMSTPFKEGNRYFYFKNDGLQNQDILYVTEDLAKEGKIFFDINKLSADGTVALAGMEFSKDGKYMAYSIARGGSDWSEIFVKDATTGNDLKDKLNWVKFSGISWYKDGFYYSRYDEPTKGKELSNVNEFHKVYYHKLGTEQKQDVLVYENKNFPKRNYGAGVTDDEKYLILSETEATDGEALYVKDLAKPNAEFVKIAEGFKYSYGVLDHQDGKLLVRTNHNAPRYKLIAIDLKDPKPEKWTDVIPEKQDVLEGIMIAGGKMLVSYMRDVHTVVEICDLSGKKTGEIELPTLGQIISFSTKKKENIAFYTFTSYTFPATIFKYDIKENKSEMFFQPKIDFDASQYETKQVLYISKDGTKVPMDLVYKKGIKLDGSNPVMIYGYGGFNVSYPPNFSITRLIWLENGGIYANAHIRGGGEYGEEWHQAGTVLKKQNVFDDFITAAEFLIKEKYTSPDKIAIMGGSNGGLLIAAVINQRPDLYKVAFPMVGVLDMLRFHKFTIGWAWCGDYGSSDNKEQFEYLYKYSPLHNIKSGVEYPATMVITADHDDRVVPAHSFKYAATLQEKYKGKNPALIRIETMAGHGAGKSTVKKIEEQTDIWSFALFNIGITPKY